VETLAFYSYKGGVGRSLFLATAARFLASLGQKVVALDLDFEAPGQHYKLGTALPAGSQEGSGGAVPYLLATAHGAASPPPLAEHVVEVPVPQDSGGWLRLIPAGPAPTRAYWSALKELREQIRFDDPSGQGMLPLLDLHARIAEELEPDYLLIDVRAGVTDLSGIATTVLADTVVCMSGPDQESVDGTIAVADAIKAAPRLQGQSQVRVVPVLARADPATSSPPGESAQSFMDSVACLAALEGTRASSLRGAHALFVLPDGDARRTADRLADIERNTSKLTELDVAYLYLFRELFPASSERVQDLLEAGARSRPSTGH
jgi:MinD-like ATPase involved in chromosome partitioning or flagellar assembly